MNENLKSKKPNTLPATDEHLLTERVQTGIKVEKRILKVLKGLAEYHDMSLGDLLEGIVLHAFEGKTPFGDESLKIIADLKRIYKLDLEAADSHQLLEIGDNQPGGKNSPVKIRKK